MKIEPKVYRLKNHIQNYQWGTKGDNAFIPKLLGIKAEEQPYAELWIGAHPKLSSEILIDGVYQKLNSIIRQFPNEILGKTIAEKFNNELPFLFKVLSAGEALSIQAHPNKEQAEKLHSLSPEHYPDKNHKPEVAVALEHLKALVGFRPLDFIEQNLNDYPQLSGFIGENAAAEFKSNKSKESLKKLFSALMQQANDTVKLETTINEIKNNIEQSKKLTEDEKLFLTLHKQYGIDIGLLVLFFLNIVNLNAGEGIFTPAGIPHAYIEGNIIECMANSDNVIRAGLTSKYKDVNGLLEILTFENGEPEIIGEKINNKTIRYNAGISEFVIDRIELSVNEKIEFNNINGVEFLLVTEGEATVKDTRLLRGESVLIPALLNNYAITAVTDMVLFRVFVP